MHLSIIVATAENGVIGREGAMPWHIPADLKYFKSVTTGKPVIMGRRTFRSIGKPLPDRTNIVITRDENFAADGVVVAHSLDEALGKAHDQAEAFEGDEVMVIGGGQIYAEALSLADRVYLTEIHARIDGDTSFPSLSPSEWREISRIEENTGEDGVPPCSFVILKRIAPSNQEVSP